VVPREEVLHLVFQTSCNEKEMNSLLARRRVKGRKKGKRKRGGVIRPRIGRNFCPGRGGKRREKGKPLAPKKMGRYFCWGCATDTSSQKLLRIEITRGQDVKAKLALSISLKISIGIKDRASLEEEYREIKGNIVSNARLFSASDTTALRNRTWGGHTGGKS